MIATDHFIFLHLHKSGGTFVNHWLARNFQSARRIGYHLPRRLIPPELTSLPVIGLVRNPWAYYVSWFTFQSNMARPNALFRALSDDSRLGFGQTIRHMVDLCLGGSRFDAAVASLPRSYGNRGLNLPAGELARIRASGQGFYSFLFHYMYGHDDQPGIARLESLRDELPPLICASGADLPRQAWDELDRPAANRSQHRPYADYYEGSLRDLIAERDAAIIGRFGYSFGH